MGLNPNKWFGNVERSMLLLKKPEIAKKARYGFCRCDESVSYVSQIQSRYDAYAKLAPLQ
jgi:membrane-bound lytic murein transglycosylase F